MKSFLHLFYLLMLCMITKSSSSKHPLCHDNERAALLQFKLSLSISEFASVDPSAHPKTKSWKLTRPGIDCCSWEGIGCDMTSGHVTILDLSSSFLSGSIHSNSSLFELVHLHTLSLADNDFKSSLIPAKISVFSNLKNLNLSLSRFSGQVPIEICQLSNLISLDLSQNLLKLRQPSLKTLLESFSSLEVISLKEASISSRVPKMLANIKSLRKISLANCGLHSAFPKGVFLMPNLEALYLYDNSNLVGHLPEFRNTSKLRALSLGNTGFSGRIPTSISNLGLLTVFSVYFCNFQGPIPYSLGKLTKLTILELSLNQFEGQIPPSLANLTKLEFLAINDNMFTGEIPSFLANFTNLSFLELGNNNLHGSITWIPNLQNLVALDLFHITLASPVEFDIFIKLRKLQLLELSNVDLILPIERQKNDTFPQFLILQLRACNLTRFPDFVHNQTNLVELDLGFNKIQGFAFVLLPLICNLNYLSLRNNNLSGKIPPCLGNLSNSLLTLDLSGNKLHGTLPELFTSTCKLEAIDLGINQLQGRIPRSLVHCSFLVVLDLTGNQIDDTFPTWLQGLPQLHSLFLGSNQFHGILPNKVGLGFPGLRIIDLSNNKFTGNLPYNLFLSWYAMVADARGDFGYMGSTSITSAFGKHIYSSTVYAITMSYKGVQVSTAKVLKIFTLVDFSRNKFVGNIPESIGNLVGLEGLNLSYNNLTGGIPSSIRNLSNLESMDLSYNMLSGEIPQQLTSLTFLEIFNVSYNNLTGPIPLGEQFNTFGNDSYRGNPELCGSPLSKKCGNSQPQSHSLPQPQLDGEGDEESSALLEWVIISMGYVSGLVIRMILGHIFTTAKHEWFAETFQRQRKPNKRGAR
ncbi:hypothetical protein Ancab_040422 [Ancistrocladus abbreviatus]